MPLQIRRGTNAERTSMAQPMPVGELLFVTDTERLYVGNGTTLGGVAITGYTNEDAVDAVGAALLAGSHTNISFLYGSTQDTANRIDAVVNLASYTGTIGATAVNSNIVADDTTVLVNVDTGSINLNGTVKGHIIPNANETYDLGSSSYKFRDLYLSGSSIKLGAATITASGSTVNLPAGSTVNGVPIPDFNIGGTLSVNIVGDDSTVMVNTATKAITAAGGFTGNLTGNVTGNVSGNTTGNHIGNVINGSSTIVVNPSLKTAYLDEVSLTGNGLITGTTMTVSTGNSVFVTQTVSGTTPLVSYITASSAAATTSSIVATRQRGTLISPTTVQASDELGKFEFSGYTGSDYTLAAGVVAVAEGTISAGVLPSRLDLKVNNSAGTTVTPMTVRPTKVEFSVAPKVPIYADVTARNLAISSPEAGMMIFLTSTARFQGYNGSTWIDF
jgi:hypothetical protein